MSKTLAYTVGLALLWPGAIGLALGAGSDPPASPQTFSEALRAAGWGVEVLDDGSLQLAPAAPTPAETPPPGPSPSELATAQPPVAPRPEAAPSPVPAAEAVDWSVLRRHGWRVERDADQATLLFPPGTAVGVEPRVAEPSVQESPAEAPRELDALLAARGWRVEREEDGSLLLFPLLRATRVSSPLAQSVGHVPSAVTLGRVSLPVDTWEKAKGVAASWLESVGDPTLRLGKIRRIHRVYLVSVLGSSPPYPLRHQIAVAVEDGRVLVLD